MSRTSVVGTTLQSLVTLLLDTVADGPGTSEREVFQDSSTTYNSSDLSVVVGAIAAGSRDVLTAGVTR